MKVLCATDFSVRARAAARIALDLARATGGSLALVHVCQPVVPVGDGMMIAETAALERRIEEESRARLAAESQALGEGGIAVTSHLAFGDARSAIVARAKATAADLIVMGAHGGAALERLVLGSVAERTVRHADRPVLIVPPGVEASSLCQELGQERGQDRERGRTDRLRVLVALDGRPASDGAVGFVRTLGAFIPCDVTFLRLYWPMEEYSRLGLTGARDLFAPDVEVTSDLARTMGAQIGTLPGAGAIRFAIKPTWGDAATRILEYAAEAESALVVMGAESRRGVARVLHPAVSNRVARLCANVPVVFAPPPAAPGALAATHVPALSTVLAATDFSEAGDRAVPHAYALLAGHGGQVELCHVHERKLASPPYAYASPEGALDGGARARIEAKLRALVPVDGERLGITTRIHVIDGGAAAAAVRQAAERLGADAIVLGAHGHGRAYHALLGSVSEEVVRHANRPVFVVPAGVPRAPRSGS